MAGASESSAKVFAGMDPRLVTIKVNHIEPPANRLRKSEEDAEVSISGNSVMTLEGKADH